MSSTICVLVWYPPYMQVLLTKLYESIVTAVTSMEGFSIEAKDPRMMLFYGSNHEIVVEITGNVEDEQDTESVRQQLAETVGKAVNVMFPETQVPTSSYNYTSSKKKRVFWSPTQGYWTSKQ